MAPHQQGSRNRTGPRRSHMSGFKNFLLRGNLVELAVAFIIAAAFAAVVTAFTAMDHAAAPRPGGHFSKAPSRATSRLVPERLIAFVLMAAVVYFFIVMPYTKAKERFFPRRSRARPRTSSCSRRSATCWPLGARAGPRTGRRPPDARRPLSRGGAAPAPAARRPPPGWSGRTSRRGRRWSTPAARRRTPPRAGRGVLARALAASRSSRSGLAHAQSPFCSAAAWASADGFFPLLSPLRALARCLRGARSRRW